MRVPETVGTGIAKVTVSFDAWKDGKVASTTHEVPILLPKSVTLAAVSPGLIRELVHPNKGSVLHGIRFTPDGKRIIAGDYPGAIFVLWEIETGKRLSTVETGKEFRGADISPDGQTLYTIRRGNPKTERLEKDGKQLTRFEFDGSIQCWDLATGKLHKSLQHSPPRFYHQIRISPTGNHLFTSEMLPGLHKEHAMATSLWDTRTGKYLTLDEKVSSRGVFSADGKTLAASTMDNRYTTSIHLLDASNGKPKLSIPVKDKQTHASIGGFSPDGKHMIVNYESHSKASTGRSFQARFEVLESATGKVVASHSASKDEGFSAKFSPDGQVLAGNNYRSFTTKQPKLLLFNISENRALKTIVLGTETKGELQVATTEPVFSPDGKRLAVVTQVYPETRDEELDPLDVPQPRILLIDVPSGEIRETLIAPQGFSRDLCFSPDGQTLAVGGYGRILLWDLSDRATKQRRGQP